MLPIRIGRLMTTIIASFIFFLIIFLGIGLLSVFKAKGNNKDYLLAGSNVKPWLAGLSAVATSNSGFMFVAFQISCK